MQQRINAPADVQGSDILADHLFAFHLLRRPARHIHVQKEGPIQSNECRAEHDKDEISCREKGGGGNCVCHFTVFTKKPCVKGAIWDAGAWEAL